MSRYEIIDADVLEALRGMPDCSFDALLSDVPYGLGTKQPTREELVAYLNGGELDTGGDFMGADWKVPSVAVWREIVRVLKPGAPVLAFAGARTFDLVGVGMRAGGLEVKETIEWLQGQGMPKPASTTDKFLDWAAGAEREVIGEQTLTGNAAVPTKRKGGTLGVQVGTVPAKTVAITAPATDLAKRWSGFGHALRPCHEPVLVARKPLDGTIAENIRLWDVCGLNIAGCRIAMSGEDADKINATHAGMDTDTYKRRPGSSLEMSRRPMPLKPARAHDAGRWTPNVAVSHTDECRRIGTKRVKTGTAVRSKSGGRNVHSTTAKPVMADMSYAGADGKEEPESWSCAPHCPARILDEQSGDRPSTLTGRAAADETQANPGDNHGGSSFGGGNSRVYADEGGASRFYATFGPDNDVPWKYVGKASTSEREFGCDDIPYKTPGECTDREDGSAGLGPQAGAGRSGGARNHGPCLKPIRFTKWLATLVLPPPRENGARRILIPYCGTGSELIGALRAGWDEIVGIERDAEFVAIAKARLERWSQVPAHMDEGEAVASAEKPDPRQPSLFGERKETA